MSDIKKNLSMIISLIVIVIVMSIIPHRVSNYQISFLINLCMYIVLAINWAFFAGTTGYISLATAAFFGIGVYVTAITANILPLPLVFVLAVIVGMVVAFIVGLSTLKLRGIYFVIFTFGLGELIMQAIKWYEINITLTVGRYILTGTSNMVVYYLMFFLAIASYLVYWYIYHYTHFGYAVRSIGQNEDAAQSMGINTKYYKILGFIVTSSLISLAGSIMALRWYYIDPHSAFNPNISFMVVVMALLGGMGRSYGPVIGVIPLIFLQEYLSISYPYHFMMFLGLSFILIIYFLEGGLVSIIEQVTKKRFNIKKRKSIWYGKEVK